MRRALALRTLPGLALVALLAPVPARAAERAAPPSWGAIASVQDGWGYAFNHASRAAAEQAARAQCERAARQPRGSCTVRISFDRACGALATGNFGEWGAATAATLAGARQAAAAQCNGHLPTEPCKGVAAFCSPPDTKTR